MSIVFNWFKSYNIHIEDSILYNDVTLTYNGGGSTSHSAGNVGKVQSLMENYSGKRIPTINPDYIYSKDEILDLIKPEEMSNICKLILNNNECDNVDMRDRIELFKELSDKGYYISYNMF